MIATSESLRPSSTPNPSFPPPTQLAPTDPNGFAALGLRDPILRAVMAEGYTSPTPIQLQSIPKVMQGHDLLGCAQT